MSLTRLPTVLETSPPIVNNSWYYWSDGSYDAAMNMAMDEALLRTAPQRAQPLLRVYRWNEPAVSIGFFQKYSTDLAPNRPVVRRPTGGGLVDHARDMTYTVAVPPGHELYLLSTPESYRLIHGAVVAALRRAGVAADLAPCCGPADRNVCFVGPVKYDVVVANQKVAGAAQRRLRCGMLHQGSILLPAGQPTPDLPGPLRLGFEQELKAQFQDFNPDPAVLQLAAELRAQKYATRQWTERFRA